MQILIACDSYKGCLTSLQAGNAIAQGINLVKPLIDTLVMEVADGGEGTANVLGNVEDARIISTQTVDPLQRTITAEYRYNPVRKRAYIDMAAASGLTLLSHDERNPLRTGSYGTGLMINDAIERGAQEIVLGLGGTATMEMGLGIIQALGAKIIYKDGGEATSPVTGADMPNIGEIDVMPVIKRIQDVNIILLTDVSSALNGADGAVKRFGPQKGADETACKIIQDGIDNVCAIFERDMSIRLSRLRGGGAAGGAGALLSGVFNTLPVDGAGFVLHETNYDSALQESRMVITGEGKSDVSTLAGKLPMTILRQNLMNQIPTLLVSGRISDKLSLSQAGFTKIISINALLPQDLYAHHHNKSMCEDDCMSPLIAMSRLRAAGALIASRINTAVFGF